MKHGDKTKGKASKASGKKAVPAGKSSSKAVATVKAKTSAEKVSSEKGRSKTGTPKGVAAETRPRGSAPDGGFNNPVVGNAFKHAIKKYPNTLRKLTD